MNADDFGLSPGVNDGILEAHAAGTVSSISMLVNAPGWEHGLAALRQMSRPPGVGLHLNLTAGEPVGEPRLAEGPTGRFPGLVRLLARALARQIDPAHIAQECAAQLARLRAVGLPVTHIDSHRHVHALPGILEAVVETARAHQVPFLRVPVERGELGVAAGGARAWGKRRVLAWSWRLAVAGVSLPRHPDHFRGLGLQGERDFLSRLLALLEHLQPGTTELMVHPGRPDLTLAAWDGYVSPRATELAALTSSRVRERLGRGDLALTNFAAL
ncbi:MAG TPA: ChbG/HpnK family deacetylase [Gemmatimonadales bacterium]|nr:ChbG/HpnK family deacetylase [Gemmatimonadales bacterium]